MSATVSRDSVIGPLRLRGCAKDFAWGKVGKASRIFPFIPNARPDGPLAEYWIGSHSKGPAQIDLADGGQCSLTEAIERAPDLMVGPRCRARFGPNLPFMVKVLSVNKDHGLSIQLHPTKEQARELRARSPQHYPDDNHKPEVGVALTPVTLLFGCKSPHQVRLALRALPEFGSFVGDDLIARFERAPGDPRADVPLVKELFSKCLTLDAGHTRACVEYLRGKLPSVSSLSREADVFARLLDRYGVGDAGLIALVFMNQIVLQPGQAIFIGANVPHAYLDGDLFECMACSDNVVRAGLTPKYRDAQALAELVDCSSVNEGIRPVSDGPDGFGIIDTPTEEFRVRVMQHGSRTGTLRASDAPGVVLCLGKGLSIQGSSTGRSLSLTDGEAAFIPPGSGEYLVEACEATVFHVTL